MAHLGDELKSWRKAKNMDQPQMSEYLDIGHRTYQAIEATGIVKKISDLNKIQSKPRHNALNP